MNHLLQRGPLTHSSIVMAVASMTPAPRHSNAKGKVDISKMWDDKHRHNANIWGKQGYNLQRGSIHSNLSKERFFAG